MQIFLGFIVLLGCSYLGFGLGNYYVRRHKFISDLITFANHLKVEISFAKSNLTQIIESHIEESDANFKSVLKGYRNTLKNSDYITVEVLKNNINTIYLEENEKEQMLQFFNFLGKSDADNQVEIINKSLNIFNNFLKTSDSEKQKYSGMYKKLGVLIGIFILVIIV